MASHLGRAVNNETDYFDILVIGKTGYGKSTTADKLVIANPGGVNYRIGHQDPILTPDETAIAIDDLSMWIAQREVDGSYTQAHEHLKNLGMFRQLDDPHTHVVESRQPGNAKDSTKYCELVSNETTKVRVLDIPGFNSMHLLEQGADQQSPFSNLAQANCGILQKLVRIQAIAGLNFSRILYFLPTRGPLERIDLAFVQELKLMKYFFGSAIFETMIVVATLRPRKSHRNEFQVEDFQETKEGLEAALRAVFTEGEGIPKTPPIIYLSVDDTCEQVLEAVKSTQVVKEKLKLEFVRDVCVRCSIKVGIFREKKVICAFGDDLTKGMPYNESLCHPLMKPKWSLPWRIVGSIGNAFVRRRKYAWVSDVVCVACLADTGTYGCMKMKSIFVHKGKEFTVDHTNQLNHIAISIDDEEEDRF